MKYSILILSFIASSLYAESSKTVGLAVSPQIWSYEGLNGPEHWAEISSDNIACRTSLYGSPINLSSQDAKVTSLAPLQFKYIQGVWSGVNNGHTLQYSTESSVKLNLGDKELSLLQFHFHTPSENQIDGKSYPLELHLVHKSKDGKIYVVALMIQQGEPNKALAQLWEKMPKEGDTIKKISADLNKILPENKSYWTFEGTLTTPPCSDDVRWILLKNSISASEGQIKSFQQLFAHNARPIQPLNGREIKTTP